MRVQSALVFVDWDSARRIGNRGDKRRNPVLEIEETVEALQDGLADAFGKIDGVVRVSWRMYHGWHEGERPTIDKRNFDNYLGSYKSRNIKKISFGREFKFGDEMLCGSMRSPLRYTLRQRPGEKNGEIIFYQKMIDTALVSDLLHAARTKEHEFIVVVGDDDDLLPGIFTAEKWGANVYFLRISNTSALPLIKGRDKGLQLSMMRKGEAP